MKRRYGMDEEEGQERMWRWRMWRKWKRMRWSRRMRKGEGCEDGG